MGVQGMVNALTSATAATRRLRRQKRHQAQTQTQTQTHRRRSSAEEISRRRCGEVAVSCCSRSSSRSLKALGACTDEVLLGQPAERIVSVHKRTRCDGCVKYCERVRTARCVYISNKSVGGSHEKKKK